MDMQTVEKNVHGQKIKPGGAGLKGGGYEKDLFHLQVL